jgi:uncharacterized protein YukE
MDPDAVRAVADQLDAASRYLSDVIAAVDRQVHDLRYSWIGGDADRFAEWWTGQHRPALAHCVNAVSGLARSARANASDQDRASGVTASGGATTTSGSGGSTASGPPISPVQGMAVGFALMASGMGPIGVGLVAHNAQVGLNQVDDGLGDTALDAVGMIPEVGPAIGFSADGAGLMQDLTTGQSVVPDIEALGWDAAGLYPPVGAFKLGLDTGTAISNIPAVHQHLDSYEDWVVANGERQGGDIGTRYNLSPHGLVNLIGDATGLSRIF